MNEKFNQSNFRFVDADHFFYAECSRQKRWLIRMEKKIITMCYRKIIDINSGRPWEKLVFADSYQEFKMQAQLYNQGQKYETFSELVYAVEGATQLHFLVSAAVIGYLRQLKEIIPDIVNNIGRQFLTFKQFKFEIINSDLTDYTKHIVAVNFYSDPLIWHETIGKYILTSPVSAKDDKEMLTDIFEIQPFLTIHSIKWLNRQ